MPVVSAEDVRDSPSVSRRHQLRFGSVTVGAGTGTLRTGAAWTGAGSGIASGSGAASPVSSSGAIAASASGASGGAASGVWGDAAGSGSLPNSLEKKPRFFGSFSLIILPVASSRSVSCLRDRMAFASAMP